MVQTRSSNAPKCHVLHFAYDENYECELAIRVNELRFWVTVEIQRLKGDKKVEAEYLELVRAVRDHYEQENYPEEYQKRKELEAAEEYEPVADKTEEENGKDKIQESQHDSAVDLSQVIDGESEAETELLDETDSGIDVNDTPRKPAATRPDHVKQVGVRDNGIVIGFDEDKDNAESMLHNWILASFGPTFAELAPAADDHKLRTVAEWYNMKVYFFTLEVKDGMLIPVELEETSQLMQSVNNLLPHLSIPKYIQNMQKPFYNSSDLTVLSTSSEPPPLHPARVQIGDKTHFLKLVDNKQTSPIKREIKILSKIENIGLHKNMHVPILEGLVSSCKNPKTKTEIMGILLTDIPSPTPLTLMLDSDVVEEKREVWAEEAKRMVDILHEHGLVWGDAKGDNFLVDANGELWIIDFGGSYTEGWIDEELVETLEGDNMGVQKVVGALEDPEANTFNPEKGKAVEEREEEEMRKSEGKGKRKAAAEEDEDGKEGQTSSKRKRSK